LPRLLCCFDGLTNRSVIAAGSSSGRKWALPMLPSTLADAFVTAIATLPMDYQSSFASEAQVPVVWSITGAHAPFSPATRATRSLSTGSFFDDPSRPAGDTGRPPDGISRVRQGKSIQSRKGPSQVAFDHPRMEARSNSVRMHAIGPRRSKSVCVRIAAFELARPRRRFAARPRRSALHVHFVVPGFSRQPLNAARVWSRLRQNPCFAAGCHDFRSLASRRPITSSETSTGCSCCCR